MKLLLPLALLLFSFTAIAKVHQFSDYRTDKDVSIQENATEIITSFHISKMETESFKVAPFRNFNTLKFNELKLSSDVGKPALPFKSIILKGMPEDFSIISEYGKAHTIKEVIPSPAMPEKLRCKSSNNQKLRIDWNSYASNKQEMIKKEYLGEFRGTHLTRVTFYPAFYNNTKQALVVYPEAKFTTKRVVLNKSRIDLDSMVMPEEIILEADLNNRYLIITPEKFMEAMEEFVNWKSQMGYEVSIFALEEIGSTTSEIQAFIADKYENPNTKFTYALLIGHETSFPTFYRNTSSSYRTPTDLPYFAFGGSSDYIPDVFYGRFVADTVEEVENIIAKTIEYESQDYVDNSGLNRTLGLASNEGSSPSDVGYVRAMLSIFDSTYQMTPQYLLQANYDSTPTTLNQALTEGVAWLNYIGHGSGYSWPSMYSTYRYSHIKEVDSEGKVKPVIIDVACQNGNYTYDRSRLGVTFMTATNNGNPTGAVAYYGGSVNISWNPPAIMAVGSNRVIATRSLQHLGEALLAGHFYLTENYTSTSSIKDNYTWYLLQGDPSLRLNF